MANGCTAVVNNHTKVAENLKEYLGSDGINYVKMILESFDGEEFKSDFKKYYEKRYNEEPLPNEKDSTKLQQIAKTIERFYYSKHGSVNAYTRNTAEYNFIKGLGYSSMVARLQAFNYAASEVNYLYYNMLANDDSEDNNKLELIGDNLLSYMQGQLIIMSARRLANSIIEERKKNGQTSSPKEVVKELKNDLAKIDKEVEGYNTAIQNQLAIFKDASVNTKKFWAELLMSDSRLNNLFHGRGNNSIEGDTGSYIDSAIEVVESEGEKTNNLEASIDKTSKRWSDDGISDAVKELSVPIRTLLASARQLTDSHKINGSYAYDTTNQIGLPMGIDVKRAFVELQKLGVESTDEADFVSRIRLLAAASSEHAHFGYIADQLEQHGDMLADAYRQFHRRIVYKTQTQVSGNRTITINSNETAFKINVLRSMFENDLKWTSLNIDYERFNRDRNNLATYVNGQNKIISRLAKGLSEEEFAKVKHELAIQFTEMFNSLIPSLNSKTIESFLENNGNSHTQKQYLKNAVTLNGILKNLTDYAQTRYQNRTEQQITIANIRNKAFEEMYQNRKAKEQKENLEDGFSMFDDPIFSGMTYDETSNKSSNKKEYVDSGRTNDEIIAERDRLIEEELNKDYSSQKQQNFYLAARQLLDYAIVNTDMNHVNAKHNQSSDVINSSMLTNLMDALNSDLNDRTDGKNTPLLMYGKFKFQSQQYDFSNILVEQWDGGQRISYGLFQRLPNGKFVPTPYAQELIKVSLFDGSQNSNNGKSALYKDMSRADYIYTGLSQYFNFDQTKTKFDHNGNTMKHDITFANYFMRIPSDAPKNFLIQMPRYTFGTGNNALIVYENSAELQQEAIRMVDNLEIEAVDDNTLKRYTKIQDKRALTDLRKATQNSLLKSKEIKGYQILNDKLERLHNGEIITVGYSIVDGNNVATGSYYKLVGKLVKNDSTNKVYIEDAKVSIVKTSNEINKASDDNFVSSVLIPNIISRAKHEGRLNDIILKKSVNRNHQLFKQYRNVAMQELTDMATAISVMYVTDSRDGSIIPDETLHPKLQPNIAEDKRQLYENYHAKYGKNGEIIDFENGWFTGSVFSDRKFQFMDFNTGASINPFQNLFGEGKVFDLIGGKETGNFLSFVMDGDRVKLNLNNEQKAAIDNAIDMFIDLYTNQSITRYEELKDLKDQNEDNNVIFNDDNIMEFALNYRLAAFAFDDIFEGDSRFYMNSRDLLKRAKEVQASGVPYSISDVMADPTTERHAIGIGTYASEIVPELNKQINQDILNSIGLDVQQMSKFRAVTIQNTRLTSDNMKPDGPIAQQVKEQLKKLGYEGMSVDHFISEMFDGYSNVTVNDAQSYITFEEWIRRVSARGQFKKYLPLIRRIQDNLHNNTPISVTDLNQFVQVQKNFYYDHYYDKTIKTMVARQIKNAEFVLIPNLIKGTELETVYNLMKELGIDQLNTRETSKASNSKTLTLWDSNTGELTQKHIDDFRANAKKFVEEYDYNHLYTQQETPQHMNTENKAGIQIMKKIIDNIPNSDPRKKLFFDLYNENIFESMQNLADDLNIPLNAKGEIDISEDGVIENLDYEKLFEKLYDNASRLGLDSNMLDFFTLDAEMPTVTGSPNTNFTLLLNNSISKLQSVAQSLFNNEITRQRLPGFHAAQITNLGFKSTDPTPFEHVETKNRISKEDYSKLSEEEKANYKDTRISVSKELRYHPDGKRYIEIMLPKSNFNFARNNVYRLKKGVTIETLAADKIAVKSLPETMTKKEMASKLKLRKYYEFDDSYMFDDAELLKQLQDAGLDDVIGYRIPTEGKQSICVMKIVGFTDDALGSTIVVPNDWVAQTGSDFDIDSVYGIQQESYIDPTTNKIQKLSANKGEATWDEYVKYITKKLKRKNENGKLSKEELNEIREYSKVDKTELNEQHKKEINDLRAKLTKNYQAIYDNLDKDVKDKYAAKKKTPTFEARLQYIAKGLEQYRNRSNRIDNLIKSMESYIDFMKNNREEYNENVKRNLSDAQKRNLVKIAEKNGFESFDDFAKLPWHKRSSREARNTELVDTMINLLQDDISLIENLTQSNFRKITGENYSAKETISNGTIADTLAKGRSAYDFMDQASYFEDVMSGAKLKGFSVTRDNFVSVCNTVKPDIADHNAIKVNYGALSKEKISNLKRTWGDSSVFVNSSTGEVIVTHNKFGWSLNNMNSDDMILTSYTSQTTAHILDAVKTGNIPNVNDFTFAVYKTFPDVGVDYLTAVAFMMNPAISYIVRANGLKNSIYASSFGNPIEEAIKNYALDNGLIADKYEHIDSVVDKINSQLGTNFSYQKNNELVLNQNDLIERTNSNSTHFVNDVQRLIHDLSVLFYYNDLNKFAQTISALARVTNPDKFGAKQSVFQTRKIFEDIEKYASDKTLTVNGKPFIQALYPHIMNSEGTKVDINKLLSQSSEDSAYRNMDSFIRYSTALSLKITTRLFPTTNDMFTTYVNDLRTYFSGDNNSLSEEQYNNFEKYCLAQLYNNIRMIKYGYTYHKQSDSFEMTSSTPVEEKRRIKGWNRDGSLKIKKNVVDEKGNNKIEEVEFTVDDFTDPTQEEINTFAKYSPAEKVAWLSTHCEDKGLIDLLEFNLLNQYEINRGISRQSIRFKDDSTDIENAFNMFNFMWNSENPLIKLTALDLIKYAFVSEQFKTSRKAINKFITHLALRDEVFAVPNNITNQIEDISIEQQLVRDFNDSFAIGFDDMYENYIRGHHDSIYQIPTFRIQKVGKTYELPMQENDLIVLNDIISHKFVKLDGKYYVDDEEVNKDIYDEMRSEYEANKKQRELAIRYGIGYENKFGFQTNNYVKLSYKPKNSKKGNSNITTLFKITKINNNVYLSPLNNLAENEYSEFSDNPQNNKYPSDQYYQNLIEAKNRYTTYIESDPALAQEAKDAESSLREKVNEYRSHDTLDAKRTVDNFDLIHPSKYETRGFSDARKSILEWLASDSKDRLRIQNMAIYGHIADAKSWTNQQSVSGDIEIDNNGKKETRKVLPTTVEFIPAPPKDRVNKPALVIVQKHQARNATLANVTVQAFQSMERRSRTQSMFGNNSTHDELALRTINRLVNNRHHKTSKDIKNELIASDVSYVIPLIGNYVHTRSQELQDIFNNFFKDSEGNWKSIADKDTIEYIRTNKKERDRYLNTLMEARAFVENFDDITKLEFNTKDVDEKENIEKVREVLDSMAKDINNLKNNTNVRKGELLFAREYLANLSSNPLVRSGMMDILDMYHDTSFIDAWFGDMQESSNAFIQVLTKEAMSDIKGKELEATDKVRIFNKKLHDIMTRADNADITIDWNNIIDENGDFVPQFNQRFINDLTTVLTEYEDAYLTIDSDPLKYVDARLNRDEFLLKYVNREMVDDYYREKLDNDIELGKNAPYHFARYFQLQKIAQEINSKRVNGKLGDEDRIRLRKITDEIQQLASETIGGNPKNDYSMGLPTDPKKLKNAHLLSIQDAESFAKYLKKKDEIEEKYFDKKARFGFKETLDKMLDIIHQAENPDAYGRPQTPTSELNRNSDYQKAKEWVALNARWVPSENLRNRTKKAYAALKLDPFQKGGMVQKALKDHRNDSTPIRDSFGNINAQNFTQQELQKIHDEEEKKYNGGGQLFRDNTLISLSRTDEIYPNSFYSSMTGDGIKNSEYLKLVNEINKNLHPYYNSADQTLDVATIINDKSKVEQLVRLYDKLAAMRAKKGSTNGKEVGIFISKYVKTVYNLDVWRNQYTAAKMDGNLQNFIKLTTQFDVLRDKNGIIETDINGLARRDINNAEMRLINANLDSLTVNEDGFIIANGEVTSLHLNDKLYGHAEPNDAFKATAAWVDSKNFREAKQQAIADLNNLFETTSTPQFIAARKKVEAEVAAMKREAAALPLGSEERDRKLAEADKHFEDWYNLNYVYNPYTHRYERLSVWSNRHLNRNADAESSYEAAFSQIDKNVKSEDFKNPLYYPESNHSYEINFKDKERDEEAGKEHDDIYDRVDGMNKYEKEVMNLVKETLIDSAHTSQAKSYFRKGHLPSRSALTPEHNTKYWLKEFGNFFGLNFNNQKTDDLYTRIGYGSDIVSPMPMLHKLMNYNDKQYKEHLANKPKEEDYSINTDEGMASYTADMQTWKNEDKEIRTRIHKESLDRNWEDVIKQYIHESSHYNAVQDNKALLYYGLQMIKQQEVFRTRWGVNDLRRAGKRNLVAEEQYETNVDRQLIDQYENWIRRIIYGQFKENNDGWTKCANVMQTLTSAKFMMFNLTGGVSNVTVGMSNILGERLAKEFFNSSDFYTGLDDYKSGLTDYITNSGSNESSTVQGAIVKYFNVVDFDGLNYSVAEAMSTDKAIRKMNDLAFAPNSSGEHFMQNGALFAMLNSNHLIKNDENDGRSKYLAMSWAQYKYYLQEKALLSILNDEQIERYKKFKETVKSDPNIVKRYNWFRKDYTTQFIRLYKDIDKSQFVAKRKELEAKAKEEFDKAPTVRSQLKLGSDGLLDFEEESVLGQLDYTERAKILGEFSRKVISVNKKIHGVYDKFGAAQLEKLWYGALVMQYHKHIYPGLLKRYKRKGSWNEERGAADVGSYTEIWDFLNTPLQLESERKALKEAGLSAGEYENLSSLQALLKSYQNFAMEFKLNWMIMPEYQRAAMCRAGGDILSALAAIAFTMGVNMGWDDKSLKQDIAPNWLLYEADSLASQAMMYNPYNMVSEVKKMWSSPFAMQGLPTDITKNIEIIVGSLFDEDFDWNQKTGRYAGENKLWVLFSRNIPIYRQWRQIVTMPKANSYYKFGTGMLNAHIGADLADLLK